MPTSASGRLSAQTVTSDSFRRAWSNFGTGVAVITSPEPGGGVHGMTANGVVSVSLEPPLALACIGRNRNSHDLIVSSKRFGLSILTTEQREVADHYTKPPEERAADHGIEFVSLGGSMVVHEALAAMDCAVVAEYLAGDHTLFVAEVENISIGDGRPMLWFQGGFGEFKDW